jgi:hypothetical protein
VKFKLAVTSGSNTSFGRMVGSGKLQCNGPATIIVTNPGENASAPFQCNATCP